MQLLEWNVYCCNFSHSVLDNAGMHGCISTGLFQPYAWAEDWYLPQSSRRLSLQASLDVVMVCLWDGKKNDAKRFTGKVPPVDVASALAIAGYANWTLNGYFLYAFHPVFVSMLSKYTNAMFIYMSSMFTLAQYTVLVMNARTCITL